MLVLFRPSPQSIVKAYLASRVHRAKPVEDTGDRPFYFEDTLRADDLDYDSLYSQFKEQFGGLDFLEDEKLNEILEDEIFWASRFKAPDRFNLVFTVLSQIEKSGTKPYLAQQSPEAKEMKDRVRRVTGEFRRAKSFIGFSEDARNRVIIGKGSFEHNIADLVLRHFAKRKPGFSVALLDDEHAHICHNDEILVDSRKRFPDKPGRKDSERYWIMLSDLKHLESKKDPAYQEKDLPRNYWKWVTEGVQEQRTVSSVTLDDFSAAG